MAHYQQHPEKDNSYLVFHSNFDFPFFDEVHTISICSLKVYRKNMPHLYELPQNQKNDMIERPAKTQIGMKKHWALSYPLSTSEDSDQTGWMPRLI